MSKKQKIILGSSLLVNGILLIIVIMQQLNANLVHEELFYSEVQDQLVELDGLIEHQKENNWSEPNLVTVQLGDVLDGMNVAINSGIYTDWLEEDDLRVLHRMKVVLRELPNDELYAFSTLSLSDKERLEDLQKKLRKAGFGMRMTLDNNWERFMDRSEKLVKSLEKD
ncbi:hypothetical protein [Bacillus sp. REN10]|uniref:hypothetical protein n=1 Tax=Bacillus sp. REN10 TaxID=2782541 RepID=UPI00193B150A|nr:hypothetical protein [Bacillus sp. REN10]